MKIGRFIKEWILIIVMVVGVSVYLAYHNIPSLHQAGPFLYRSCTFIQPILLFCMLFLAFCKVEPKDFKLRGWHFKILAFQCLSFIALALLLLISPAIPARMAIMALMLCFICPTGTSTPVVVNKLGGDIPEVVSYTVLINVAVAVLVPIFLPLVYPKEGLTFIQSFWRIMMKVFPLLVLPCVCAWLVRYRAPRLHSWFLKYVDASFYIWAASLMIAIIISTRALVISGNSLLILLEMSAASLISCFVQFALGRKIGSGCGRSLTARQALGQKNTSFGIWLGYTFFDPVVSVAYGFYCIWQNSYNTWQLRHPEKCRES